MYSYTSPVIFSHYSSLRREKNKIHNVLLKGLWKRSQKVTIFPSRQLWLYFKQGTFTVFCSLYSSLRHKLAQLFQESLFHNALVQVWNTVGPTQSTWCIGVHNWKQRFAFINSNDNLDSCLWAFVLSFLFHKIFQIHIIFSGLHNKGLVNYCLCVYWCNIICLL